MNKTKRLKILVLSLVFSPSLFAKELIVTKDNYPLVETHRQMAITQDNAGGINIFDHKRSVPPVNNQPVIRMNRDTLYSMALIDARKVKERLLAFLIQRGDIFR